MSVLTANQVRQGFLDYFRERGHTVVPSSPVVAPGDDPTLYFTNAGMNQFKDVFLGTGSRDYTRAVDTQKCMRVTGKHNDLEDVGKDHYHHTLFEMLGNWSFGDYYKEEAIEWAWKLLTEVWGLDPKRLHATVYTDDDEAEEIWKNFVVDPSYITRHGKKDNFWEMGDTGPCGPCTELHYDLGEEFTSVANSGPNLDDARFREIWNLVFIQFDRKGDGSLVDLPAKHVDTGMGFERIVTILQGETSHYATDLFQPTIQWVAKESGVAYDAGEKGIPHRVIADHLRAVGFTIADGVIPSNEGRGYVIRRILRRAARYGKTLGLEKPFLHRLVPYLVEGLGHVFPELGTRQAHLEEVIKSEEERFSVALEKGSKLFLERAEEVEAQGGTELSGDTVFYLYDTHGFPMDLTRLMAQERGLEVDEAGFEKAREESKARTREASRSFQLDADLTQAAEGQPETQFLGYQSLKAEAEVLNVVAKEDGTLCLVLDQTPCYAEGGGQVSDQARFVAEGFEGQLEHVNKVGSVLVHQVKPLSGCLEVGQAVQVEVPRGTRDRTACHHTATHLLHQALKEVLGDHVAQAGSLVAPDRLRFDFSHSKPLSDEEVTQIEARVNAQIQRGQELNVVEVSRSEADSMGAVALFGEKYGDQVRVVQVPGFSTELCGGTHVTNTQDIQRFKLLSQTSVAANVRRVECLAGPALVDHLESRAQALEDLANKMKCPPDEIPAKIEKLEAQLKQLEKDLKKAKSQRAVDPGQIVGEAKDVPGRDFRLAAHKAEGLSVPELRDLSDAVLAKLGAGVVLLATEAEDKVHFVCKVHPDLLAQGASVHAGKLIREVAEVTGGRGGGKAEMAMAGGKDASKIPAAFERGLEILSQGS